MSLPDRALVREWGVQEVQGFLQQAGLEDCGAILEKKGVDGLALLGLNDSVLQLWSREMKIMQIKKLSKLVAQLNPSPATSLSPQTSLSSRTSLSPRNSLTLTGERNFQPNTSRSFMEDSSKTKSKPVPSPKPLVRGLKLEEKSSNSSKSGPNNSNTSRPSNCNKNGPSNSNTSGPSSNNMPSKNSNEKKLPYRTTLNRPTLRPVTPGFVKHIGLEDKEVLADTKGSVNRLGTTTKDMKIKVNQAQKPTSPKPLPKKIISTNLVSSKQAQNRSVSPKPLSPKPLASTKPLALKSNLPKTPPLKPLSPKPTKSKPMSLKPSSQKPAAAKPPTNNKPTSIKPATQSVIKTKLSKNLSPKPFVATKPVSPKPSPTKQAEISNTKETKPQVTNQQSIKKFSGGSHEPSLEPVSTIITSRDNSDGTNRESQYSFKPSNNNHTKPNGVATKIFPTQNTHENQEASEVVNAEFEKVCKDKECFKTLSGEMTKQQHIVKTNFEKIIEEKTTIEKSSEKKTIEERTKEEKTSEEKPYRYGHSPVFPAGKKNPMVPAPSMGKNLVHLIHGDPSQQNGSVQEQANDFSHSYKQSLDLSQKAKEEIGPATSESKFGGQNDFIYQKEYSSAEDNSTPAFVVHVDRSGQNKKQAENNWVEEFYEIPEAPKKTAVELFKDISGLGLYEEVERPREYLDLVQKVHMEDTEEGNEYEPIGHMVGTDLARVQVV